MPVRLALVCVVIAGIVAAPAFRSPTSPLQTRTLEVSFAQLQTALADQIATSAEVGFLPRARFNRLTWDFDDGLGLEGSGNWLNASAGGFVLPDVTLAATIPADAWTVRDGGLAIARVQITHAYRESFNSTPGRDESEANRQGWQGALTKLLGRLDPFAAGLDDEGDWRIISVRQGADGLTFTLEK